MLEASRNIESNEAVLSSFDGTISEENKCVGGISCSFRMKWIISHDIFIRARNLSRSTSYEEYIEMAGSEFSFDGNVSRCSEPINHEAKYLPAEESEVQTIRSMLYSLVSVENLSFYLALGFNGKNYFVRIERNPDFLHRLVELQYAFVTLNNRIYHLFYPSPTHTFENITHRLLTPYEIFRNQESENSLCVYLMIAATAENSGYTSEFPENILNVGNFAPATLEYQTNTELFNSGINKIDFRNELIHFWNGGEFPKLDIERAKLLISHKDLMKIAIFKALGMEHLIENLNIDTVLDLLAFSISYKIAYLKDACFNFLFEKCKIEKIEKKKQIFSIL